MTSFTPAAGHARPVRTARPAARDRLVATPVVAGVRSVAVGLAAPVATAAAAAGAVAVGGGAAFDVAAGVSPTSAGVVGAGAAPAVALGLFGVGIAVALVVGTRSSDRSGRRRGTALGLGFIAAAVLVSSLVGFVAVGGLLAGVGVVAVAMAAPAWLRDIRMPRSAVSALSLVSVAAGAAAGVFAPWPSVVVLVLAAALFAVVAPETVPGPQTPTWGFPAKPDLRGRGASVAVIALVAVVAPFAFLPLAPAAVGAGVVAVGVAFAVVAVAVQAGAEVSRRRAAAGAATSARVVLARPGTRAHKAATRAFDPTEKLRPARAVVATTADEVAAAVREADALGIGVRMHTTGHASASSSDMSQELLVKVRLDGGVTVDVERKLVRIPAGTQWRDVVAAAAPHGLAVPHGSSGHVGVVGYISRGGLSAYGRTTGVAANHLESVELVTADGQVVTASREVEPDLFYAVRGGGGGFGVITAVTVRAFDPGRSSRAPRCGRCPTRARSPRRGPNGRRTPRATSRRRSAS
ncbi:FAD-binding oxidoreductase [Agromyces protaetiae]|uniref:FAD-binding oxidoreductase n=1 Tax=Agromyces protaetiae TaxID=2509455 RepID=A0A4P6FRV4_9MICO|nr:FAD-dependent oxidoreductase [Agromyces protaetiae]QAY73268.1 FAD-binding oxidoreductase [Agromyces protaetiae]